MTSSLQSYRLPKLHLAAFVILHYDVESQKHIRHKRGCVEIGTAPYRDIGGIQSIFLGYTTLKKFSYRLVPA